VRLKVIDACGLTCTFCHNEGTPVVADNLSLKADQFRAVGRSHRVSIYVGRNGARFLPATVEPDDELIRALTIVRDALDADELHLTGGEPTLHPRLAQIIGAAHALGFRVRMTSNGENGARTLPECVAAGLEKVNFSVFGTTAQELAQVQHARFRDVDRASRKLAALYLSMQTALAREIAVSANIVVPTKGHVRRARRLFAEYGDRVSVRLLNSLDDGRASLDAIAAVLAQLGAEPVARHLTAGVSGCRTTYRVPDGRTIDVKEIRRVRLPETCVGCRFNNPRDCHEGFYGVRLYRDRAGGYQVGVCIQRMDLCMPVEEFAASAVRDEIIRFRDEEFRHLSGT
jgi:GTP 3',8-cyclase